MSAEAVRATFAHEPHEMTERLYPPDTALAGRTRAATWFVLRGACRVATSVEVTAREGDIIEIEAADFALQVLGDRELHLLEVCAPAPRARVRRSQPRG